MKNNDNEKYIFGFFVGLLLSVVLFLFIYATGPVTIKADELENTTPSFPISSETVESEQSQEVETLTQETNEEISETQEAIEEIQTQILENNVIVSLFMLFIILFVTLK